MNKRQKYITGVAGIICMIIGIFAAIPSLMNNQYYFASIAAAFVIGGLILLAISFGD